MQRENSQLSSAVMKLRKKTYTPESTGGWRKQNSLIVFPTPNQMLLLGRLVHNLEEKYDSKIKKDEVKA